jgi:hypothetical protein
VRLVEAAPVAAPVVTADEAAAPDATVADVPPAEPLVPSGPDTGEAAVAPVEQAAAGTDPSTAEGADADIAPTDEAAVPPAPANLAEDASPLRAYSSVPIAPFSPLNAAGPQNEPGTSNVPEPEDETTGLMDAPPIGGQIDEPPLVLILTPPPEVPGEPRPPVPEPAPTTEAAEAPADQAPLFDPTGEAAGVNEGDPVIYYEPEDEAGRSDLALE